LDHTPVLLNEVIKNLNINPDGIYLDATVGCGGHSSLIAQKLSERGKLVCIDQDNFAIKKSRDKLKDFLNKIIFMHANFCEIINLKNKFDGILFDLGLSDLQINTNRGFSYMHNEILDMRMDTRTKISALDIINNFPEKKIADIIKNYGQERFYKQIARKIILQRNISRVKTTFELVNIIKSAMPKKYLHKDSHPAKKTFQAIRIFVNQELENLDKSLDHAVKLLNPKGRICVISFHSLEDKLVKNKFKYLSSECVCSKELPVCVCKHEKKYKLITKRAIRASEQELKNNFKSHSANLRVLEKI